MKLKDLLVTENFGGPGKMILQQTIKQDYEYLKVALVVLIVNIGRQKKKYALVSTI